MSRRSDDLRAFLHRASARIIWLGIAEGAALGLLAAAVETALADRTSARSIPQLLSVAVGLCAAGILARLIVWRFERTPVATLVERRAPQCKNLVITAAELIEQPVRTPPHVIDLVCDQATRVVATLDTASLFPARRSVAALAACGMLWAGSATIAVHPGLAASLVSGRATSIDAVEVEVTPPLYTGRPSVTVKNPARIDALAGSRIRLTVHSRAQSVSVETLAGTRTLAAGAAQFTGDILADADGYVAIEASAAGHASERRLIGLSVTPDHPPRVRVTAPARDLFFPDAKRSIGVTVDADDDIGLSSLRLRYTKVSGSGEQFTFTEGETPLTITRTDGRHWQAHGTLHVDSLALAQGDLLVYRGAATDGRPGSAASESDSYIIEISAPGSAAVDGFAADDERDRYAVSQQMVILKTERLLAAKPGITHDSLVAGAMAIAAEQRAVRAQFVFMMGGELAEDVINAADMNTLDETAEANGESDLAAGRLANAGRLDLVRAIRSMSKASTSLVATELDQGLTDERAALTYLQWAFARARYILRALTLRERLDLSRRLTGELSALVRSARPAAQAAGNPRIAALRQALAAVATLAAPGQTADSASRRASAIAERVLQVDPSADALQHVAARLGDAATAFAGADTARARTALDSAAVGLASAVRAGLVPAPRQAGPMTIRKLDGALTDGLRQAGAVKK